MSKTQIIAAAAVAAGHKVVRVKNPDRFEFSRTEGLEIQAKHLAEWRTKLNADCYLALAAKVAEENATLAEDANGWDIFRGQSLDEFVHNWQPSS